VTYFWRRGQDVIERQDNISTIAALRIVINRRIRSSHSTGGSNTELPERYVQL
jgi:hypothetical protein